MIALDNGWPLESMCIESHHYNKDRPRGNQLMDSLKPEVRDHLEKILAPDNAVYKCAKMQHKEHVKEHTINGVPMHTIALNHFQSENFQAECEVKSRLMQQALGERRKADKEKGLKKFRGEVEWVLQGRRRRLQSAGVDVDVDGLDLEENQCIMSRPRTPEDGPG
jgi:hypothetical protein